MREIQISSLSLMASVDSNTNSDSIQKLVGPLRFQESRSHTKIQKNEMKLSFSKWYPCVGFPLLRSKGKDFCMLAEAGLLSYTAQPKGQLGA